MLHVLLKSRFSLTCKEIHHKKVEFQVLANAIRIFPQLIQQGMSTNWKLDATRTRLANIFRSRKLQWCNIMLNMAKKEGWWNMSTSRGLILDSYWWQFLPLSLSPTHSLPYGLSYSVIIYPVRFFTFYTCCYLSSSPLLSDGKDLAVSYRSFLFK